MLKYKILNSKEVKSIIEKINSQFDCELDKNDMPYVFIMNKDNKIYIISKKLSEIPYDDLKIDVAGLYFGEIYKDKLRLSIEGSQIIGSHAKKNIYDANYEQMILWIKGNDIEFEDTGEDFVILRYKDPKTGKYDYLGCGRYNTNNGKLMNYVSKSRRLIVVNN
ncbi:MAG: hypothetical protein KatS3mg002_1210 [Candidatus Woesearchaeota archaeon]|nr:MAG: hypothetical protein KatS3mg002_1210 [Candidatus Woesearchaeota archaeon]